MNIFTISWQNFRGEIFRKSLNIILVAFGIAIINSILLLSNQLEQRMEAHAGKVDLVVGAKGSPMQLILSSLYHADFPTGNIKLELANKLMKHPYVKQAAPLSLGDSHKGFRIVGTTEDFMGLYQLTFDQGDEFPGEFEALAGSEVAKNLDLKIGSQFYSSHGLTEGGDSHHHPFRVTGILKSSGTVADRLILTNLESIWHAHGQEGDNAANLEITSLLIKYNTPLAIAVFPQMVNLEPNLQAASPALETARLFSLMSTGFEITRAFGLLVILLAAFSVFMVLFTSLSERKMDIALIRTMGAGRPKVAMMMAIEGIIIAAIGTFTGIGASHLLIAVSSGYLPAQQAATLSGMVFYWEELIIVIFGLGTGLLASMIPAIVAYRTDISKVLARGQ